MSILILDGTYNARGIGRPASPWLVRSASLDALTDAGRDSLHLLGIGLIVDLRDDLERVSADRGIPADHGIPVAHMPIYRSGAPAAGVLEDVYESLLLTRGDELVAVVAAIADSTDPVLVHCAAGKDRTGLVVALLLLAAGATEDEVLADYALSAIEVGKNRRESALREVGALGLTDDDLASALRLHLESPADALRHAFDVLHGMGGVSAYLMRHGLTTDQFDVLRERLRESRDEF